MRSWIVALIILLATHAHGSQGMGPGPGLAGGGTAAKTYLLQEDFETGTLTNELSTINSWTEDTANAVLIIDNTNVHSGSKSVKMLNSASGKDYKSFTNQTTGKFTLSLWYYHSTSSTQRGIVAIRDTTDSAKNWSYLQVSSNDIVYSQGGNGSLVTHDTNLAASTWHHIEIEVDVDAGTQKIFINGTQINPSNEGKVYTASVSPDGLWIFSTSASSNATWIDDVEIYQGARQ